MPHTSFRRPVPFLACLCLIDTKALVSAPCMVANSSGARCPCVLPRTPRLSTPVDKGIREDRNPRTRTPTTTEFGKTCLLAILLDPVAFVVFLVFLFHGAPGDAVGAILLPVLVLCGVEGLFVDLLGVFGEVVLDVIRQLGYLLVGHRSPPSVL